MAHTPDDPTKPQVWVEKGLDELDFEFYIPQGPKGDPGGLTSTVLAGGTNLNDIISAGAYSVTAGTTSIDSALANLPVHEAGSLVITFSGNNSVQIQTYTTNTKSIYVRRRFGSTWSSWRHFGQNRADNSAGRQFFGWDQENAREQMIWGDTGRRNITALASGVTAGTIYLRRMNSIVSLVVVGANVPNNSSLTFTGLLPSGFKPYANSYFQFREGTGDPGKALIAFSNGDVQIRGVIVGTGGISSVASWDTIDPWPTTLPGDATGGIMTT